MTTEQIKLIGIVAGILTSISLLPQLVKIIRARKAEDLSIPMLATLFCGVALWIYYGWLREDWPVMITNMVSLSINSATLIISWRYQHPD